VEGECPGFVFEPHAGYEQRSQRADGLLERGPEDRDFGHDFRLRPLRDPPLEAVVANIQHMRQPDPRLNVGGGAPGNDRYERQQLAKLFEQAAILGGDAGFVRVGHNRADRPVNVGNQPELGGLHERPENVGGVLPEHGPVTLQGYPVRVC